MKIVYVYNKDESKLRRCHILYTMTKILIQGQNHDDNKLYADRITITCLSMDMESSVFCYVYAYKFIYGNKLIL